MEIEEIVKGIKPCKFRYKGELDNGKLNLGVMAQDIVKLYPVDEYSIVSLDENGFYQVDYTQLIPLLLKNIQVLNERVQELENKNL